MTAVYCNISRRVSRYSSCCWILSWYISGCYYDLHHSLNTNNAPEATQQTSKPSPKEVMNSVQVKLPCAMSCIGWTKQVCPLDVGNLYLRNWAHFFKTNFAFVLVCQCACQCSHKYLSLTETAVGVKDNKLSWPQLWTVPGHDSVYQMLPSIGL